MARINAYPYDTNVTDIDAWIGTDSTTRQTKQFTAAALANYLNIKGKISIGGQMNYRFIDAPSTTTGTFAFAAGGGDQTSWANITSIVISTSDLSNQVVTPFLAYLVDEQILFQDVAAKSSFGHYIIRGYTQLGSSSFYTLTLEYIGGNGNITTDNYYTLVNFYLEQGASGVTSVDSSNTTFIDMTPTTPTSGNVELTASLSATGTPGSTNFLRGDNTWAIVGTDIVEGTGTTNFVAKWLDTDTIGNSVIFDSGSFVGIGTNTPSKILQVGDGTGLDDTIRVVYNDGEYTDIHGYGLEMSRTASYIRPVTDGTGNLNIGENLKSWNSVIQNADTHIFSKDTSERMRITSTGNVGIGTTSPTNKLDVSGNVSATSLRIGSSASGEGIIRHNPGTGNGIGITTGALSSSGIGLFVSHQSTNRNVGIGTTSPTYKLQVAGKSYLSGGIQLNSGDEIDFGNSQQYITGVNSTSLTLVTGNSATLTALNSGQIQINSYGSGTFTGTATQRLGVDTSGNVIEIPIGSGAVDGAGTTNFVTKWLDTDTVGDSVIFDNGTNVGIGTTSPVRLLSVNGIQGWNAGNTEKAYMNPTSTGVDFKLIGNNGDIRFDSRAGSNSYINTGNVGIGTTTPSHKLSVFGGNIEIHNGGATWLGSDATGGFARTFNGNTFRFISSANAETMRIDNASGNVGIGTTSPSAQLHSNASGSAINYGMFTIDTDNWINFFTGTGTAPGASAAGQGALFWKSGGVLRLGTSTSTAGAGFVDMVRIDTDGNVGIGTTNPLAKLDITSTTDGVLLPRMTTTQVNAISSPENGLTVYNTTLNTLCFYNGSSWQKVTTANM